jgi:hypothetical protein
MMTVFHEHLMYHLSLNPVTGCPGQGFNLGFLLSRFIAGTSSAHSTPVRSDLLCERYCNAVLRLWAQTSAYSQKELPEGSFEDVS